MSNSAKRVSEFVVGEIKGVVVYPLKRYFDERGWLAELFRHDELAEEFYPVMSYISFTKPGIQRGPHEHVGQADLFCFIGPSTFRMRMWDNRPDSPTFNHMMSFEAGFEDPLAVVVPKGVVHGYKNIGNVDGMVINCPNRLYMGHGKKEPIDEIRHEDDPETIFRMD
ncbi:MAG TPA: dTDP-4-dehydrorhamnose 3,5-epimerase family protein [Pyrinomonadaceae bacterium]|nr:dTDP-4-dehydrorhamnose 3,5-epimerase family protein [Chloracidobacterium sp.]HBE81578.1 dTDP-4-dehydrorhamnose 3,5-epimerase [Blastocatellia bacterium]HRJ88822.1 dTDP-4-dehydrorhamnose 3,5-epimerase family protein [Pyrinomonadaceae bacterium]HRK48905.1 dTDP-4-dehydrorhamnose 3,5-epimerase family protein [Pyrinomonadaceae bacterium]